MLAARTGLSPVMVGRADELARLRELVATTGDPAVALISGEAGIGKTRLVAELVAELVATLPPTPPVLAGQGVQGPAGPGRLPASLASAPRARGRLEERPAAAS
jgi:D-serine deaminase-like pyridoxal phosphate-dependent protein